MGWVLSIEMIIRFTFTPTQALFRETSTFYRLVGSVVEFCILPHLE